MTSISKISRSESVPGKSWQRRMLSVGSAVADLIYPPRCAWCQQDLPAADHVGICPDCRSRLAPAGEGGCRRCGAPIEAVAAQVETCGHCHGKSFPWERAVALGPYRGELGEAIVRTKRAKNEPLVFALGRLLAAERGNELSDLQVDAVVPMPMHWLRRVRRGTNGPDLLAEALARCLNIPMKTGWLRRRRLTSLQVEIAPSERLVQQRKSFSAVRKKVHGRRILLVDDVLTTGATAVEASRTLLEAGAAVVNVAVIARAVGDDAL